MRTPAAFRPRFAASSAALIAGMLALSACGSNGWDSDLRRFGSTGFDTTDAARQATLSRPRADSRGVISYPTYQVAVARRGDTVSKVANRVGVDAQRLASFNALTQATTLAGGEVLVLPTRVSEPSAATGAAIATTALPSTALPSGGASSSDQVDVTSLASAAIGRASAAQTAAGGATTTASAAPAASPAPTAKSSGPEPARHRVARGETAFTIARYYNVSPKALAEWNGLPADMSVREGQQLLIPPAVGGTAASSALTTTTAPGQGSPTPEPPSASEPLPTSSPVAASTPVDASAAPDLGASRSAATQSQLLMPVSGKIVRPYVKKKNDGIDISAAAGTPVKAAEAGTVAAITKDTEQVPILVIRHTNGLLTVYANVTDIAVAKGESVSRGQTIARMRAGADNALHFEVRKGFDSVDPVPYVE